MESNKLIAEFMGYTHQSDSEFKDENGFWNDFEVFETWNWLMPVVNEIENYLSKNVGKVGYFDECLNSNDLDIRYQAVVEFIKQYNDEQNKT